MKRFNISIKKIAVYVCTISVVIAVFSAIFAPIHPSTKEQFNERLASNSITDATVIERASNTVEVRYKANNETYSLYTPESESLIDDLQSHGVLVATSKAVSLTDVLLFIIVTIGVFGTISYLREKIAIKRKQMLLDMALGDLSNISQNLGMPNNMTNTPPKTNEPEEAEGAKRMISTVRFKDVAGYKDEKQEVTEIIDFLKNPKKYKDIGATVPKGVLLMGPPGTGKTLMAKAIAGEADVNFLYASGSEFVERYVGVGASRVRQLFAQAREQAPCILFIDEIDAVGRQRTGDSGSQEHDQTLNQILVEMDGIDSNGEILVIGATNRPEMLDKAFLRKGRFDRKVQIGLPDTDTRYQILKVHAQKKKLGNVNLKDVARKTNGLSGADLYAVLNEAALMAVRSKRDVIQKEDVDEAIDRVLMGHSIRGRKYGDFEKKLVAYHECGHVLVGLYLDDAAQVDKVTIIPRGDAGGYTLFTPKEETFLSTKKALIEKICGLLGGRVAEEMTFGVNNITTGASDDLSRATAIARAMVTQYGMSKLGIMKMESYDSSYSGSSAHVSQVSSQKEEEIDKAVEEILDECYKKTKSILTKHRTVLDALSSHLIEKETLNAKEIRRISKNVKQNEAIA